MTGGIIADAVALTCGVIPMTDYINRETAIAAMFALCDEQGTLAENPYRDNPHIDDITDCLENLPAAEIRAFLISPVGLMVGDPVWLEVFSHGDGKYCVFPCEVKWIEDDGLCMIDGYGCGHYCKIDDFNEGYKRATFGWRCWNECPTPKRMEAIPWNE